MRCIKSEANRNDKQMEKSILSFVGPEFYENYFPFIS